VRGKQRINIFILHPKGRVSPVQERQMTTVLDANVHNLAVRGTFDDAQRIVKTLFNDLDFKAAITSAPSTPSTGAHPGADRLLLLRLGSAQRRRSGAEGQLRGAHRQLRRCLRRLLARRMGLPIDRLIIATNRNDILTRFVDTGVYAKGEVYHTLSPAMDIQIASNFERYLYYLLDEDRPRCARCLPRWSRPVACRWTASGSKRVQADFDARAVTDPETLAQIRETYEASGYILCPHTAVGARASADQPDAVVLATAHPAKFNEAVREAIGSEAPPPPSLQGLMDKPTRCAELDAEPAAVREHIAPPWPRRPDRLRSGPPRTPRRLMKPNPMTSDSPRS
jgi:threonine synthase